jgi:hypothetical protein
VVFLVPSLGAAQIGQVNQKQMGKALGEKAGGARCIVDMQDGAMKAKFRKSQKMVLQPWKLSLGHASL